ncbi:MAG: hypothetical protein A2061_01730 [Gallionellales bacterium GWA2_59_43]|nr:MAG: hypothetical protein A2061_01730 [Gallionellales bacterium GWA2_59_43]
MPLSVNSTCDLSHSGLPDFVAPDFVAPDFVAPDFIAMGSAPPGTNRPPKNYREIFQVLLELTPEHEKGTA